MTLPNLNEIIQRALDEDAAFHDITTSSLVPKNRRARAILLAKEDLILCGMPLLKQVIKSLDPGIKLKTRFQEGKKVRKGQAIAELSGKAGALLSGERVALNFLQRLSGIATLTRRYVDAVAGTGVKILDTRKTTPGLRLLEKYAVKTGGGFNHRFDLKSVAMVKDNHWVAVGSITGAWRRLLPLSKKIPVILEIKTLSELKEALACGAPYLQLDNMGLPLLKKAVALVRRHGKNRSLLEATGGVNLKNIRSIAKTGIDFISVGALTHSAPAVDISLEFEV